MVRGLPIQWDCSLRSTTIVSGGMQRTSVGNFTVQTTPPAATALASAKFPTRLNGFCSYSTKSNLQWLLPRIMGLTGYPLQAQRKFVCVGESHTFKRLLDPLRDQPFPLTSVAVR